MRTSEPRGRSIRLMALICGGVVVMIAVALIARHTAGPNIAYVRSNDLIAKYAGTIESHQVAQKEQEKWRANLDTLHGDYRRAVNLYNETYAGLSAPERKDREENLGRQKDQVASYAQEVERLAAEEEEKLMQGVLSQINTFIAVYGKEHGYDMILGTTAAGSLLYAEDGYDITDDVLQGLNAHYKTSDATSAAK